MSSTVEFLAGAASVFWKVNRLKTFEHWPFQSSDNVCNPNSMAEAGFIAVGGMEEPDLVECFICRKQLDGWDPDDKPWKEHIKHEPTCPFVKLRKSEELWTVSDLFELTKIFCIKECEHELNIKKSLVKGKAKKMANEIPNLYKRLRKTQKRNEVDND